MNGLGMPGRVPRCLLITEILMMILEYVSLPGCEHGLRTLANLARTCRAFHQPALGILWRDIGDLRPFIRCLPTDLLKESSTILKRDIVPLDLDRIPYYASFVRSLGSDSPFVGEELTTLLYKGLCSYSPSHAVQNGGSLMPNLLRLRWYAYDDARFVIIYWIITPSLTTLHLTSLCPETLIVPFLNHIGENCPYLQKVALCLYGLATTQKVYIAVSELVPKLSDLRSFSCNATFVAALFPFIAVLPRLEQLQLEFNNTTVFVPPPLSLTLPVADRPFASLKRVGFDSDRLESCTSLISLLQSASVTQAYFSMRQYTSRSSVERFVLDLTRHLSHPSLKRLLLLQHPTTLPSDAALREEYILPGSALLPLLKFINLRHLRVDVQCGFDIDDSVVSAMATAWPKLRLLQFGIARGLPKLSKISLGALALLARDCPAVTKLNFPIDARLTSSYRQERERILQFLDARPNQTKTNDRSSVMPSNKRVRAINVGESFIQNPAVVAALLLDIFPRLEYVRGVEVDRMIWSNQRDKWYEVQLFVEKHHEDKIESGEDRVVGRYEDETDDGDEWEYDV